MPGAALLSLGSGTNSVRIFVSYDREHDADLLDQLLEQASRATSGFDISGRSATWCPTDHWDEALRCKIREADQVIVICGQHTDHSDRVGAELLIAQEEERPYTLLWGRREPMCTKPTTAKPADTMYSWTPEILQAQISTRRRLAESDQPVAEPGHSTAPPTAEHNRLPRSRKGATHGGGRRVARGARD